MTIAAHITSIKNNGLNYLYDNIIFLAAAHPDDHFILLMDDITTVKFTAENITPVQVSPAIRNSLTLYYWYNFKLPALLKRYNATALISEHNTLSLRTTISQYLFIKEISFLLPQKNPCKRFLLKYFPRFAEKAEDIFTTEKNIAAMIQEKYPATRGKGLTVYHELNKHFQPVSWQQKETITAAFTGEKDFFLYYVSANTTHYIKTALKAFSIFKKWQKSGMQLVLLLDGIAKDNLIPDLGSYKYREEVMMITPASETDAAQLTASAYAAIYLPQHITGENFALNAMQSHTPVITLKIAETVYGEAAAYTDTGETSVAEQMLLLYKNEALKKLLQENGTRFIIPYSLQRSASDIWAVIASRAGKSV